MADIRKIIIIFVVAVLFAILVFAVIGAVYPQPEHQDFCKRGYYPEEKFIQSNEKLNCTSVYASVEDQKKCDEKNGIIDYTIGSKGCAVSYECNTCQHEFDLANKKYQLYVFYISAILSLIAIFIGLYLPAKANTLNEWIGTGFMLGGTFSLFFGTAFSYTSLARFEKPIVLLLELGLIIFIAYRKVGNLRKDKKKK
jgi:hypothetical protein